jgi:UDP-N-acetylmuramyl pentapeptide phosphotransferase/UDP-N-acetylglucosamine-1-phosphate transferase
MPFALALALSLPLMPVARWLGPRTGFIDRPADGGLKIHRSPVSVLGGPAVVVVFLITLGIVHELTLTIGLGIGLATAVGLVDDVRPLPPVLRIVALGIAGGLTTQALPLPGGWILGAFLGVVCANGVNLVDGQDALAAGLATIAALFMAACGAFLGDASAQPVGLALAGALVAFLAWNRPPAVLFLGNGGAYGVGLALAGLVGMLSEEPVGLVVSGLCLGPFAFELTLTTIRRVTSRSSLVTGDRRHTYDVLAKRWGSRSRSTVALFAAAVVSGVLGLTTAALSEPERLIAPLVWAGFASLAGLLMWRAAAADDHDLRDDSPGRVTDHRRGGGER